MVIREYECSGCGETHDYLLKQNEEPEECFNCSGPASRLRKLISAPSIGNSSKGSDNYIHEGIIFDSETGNFAIAHTTKEIRDDRFPNDLVGDFVLENGRKISNLGVTESLLRQGH